MNLSAHAYSSLGETEDISNQTLYTDLSLAY